MKRHLRVALDFLSKGKSGSFFTWLIFTIGLTFLVLIFSYPGSADTGWQYPNSYTEYGTDSFSNPTNAYVQDNVTANCSMPGGLAPPTHSCTITYWFPNPFYYDADSRISIDYQQTGNDPWTEAYAVTGTGNTLIDYNPNEGGTGFYDFYTPGLVGQVIFGVRFNLTNQYNAGSKTIYIDAVRGKGSAFYVTPTPTITPTGTPIATITPTGTPEPCPLVDTGQVAAGGGEENFLIMTLGDEELIATFDQDGAIVFGDETIYCAAGNPCNLHADSRLPGQSFWCYFPGTGCQDGTFEARSSYCPGSYSLPEFDSTGVEGSGLTWTEGTTSCVSVDLFEFNLADFTLLDIIADTFGLTVPEWGWAESTWELCLERWQIDTAEIGGFDFEPMISLVLSALVLLVAAWVVRR